MENPVFLVVEATANTANIEDLQQYQSLAPTILKKYGGVPVASYNVEAAIYTQEKPAAFAVFSFPSREAIQNLLVDDAEYQKLIPIRDKAFKSIKYFVCSEKV